MAGTQKVHQESCSAITKTDVGGTCAFLKKIVREA